MTFVLNFVRRHPEVKYCLGCNKPITPQPGSYSVAANRKWCNACAAEREKQRQQARANPAR